MLERTLSAPGKLFLSGEYAVLWGGTARLVGVAPRAHAFVRTRDDRQVDVVLEHARLTGLSTPAGVRWNTPPSQDFLFVARTIDLALRTMTVDPPGFQVAFEPSPLVNGFKLGLGSSARATVLAAEAARVALGADFDTLKLALLAHADAQGGKGSGGDVAASMAGGLLRYRRYEVKPLLEAAARRGLAGALAAAEPVDLARLGIVAFPIIYAFSGGSASTTSLVREVERTFTAADRQRFVERSDGAGDLLERGLLRGQFADVEAGREQLQELLWGLGVTRHEGLTRVIDLARAFSCAGKQSGAGGGDGAIVFAPDRAAQQALLEAYAARNIHAFPISAGEGLRGEVVRHAALASWL